MRDHGWHLEGKQEKTRKWVKVFKFPAVKRSATTDSGTERFEPFVRSVRTPEGKDAGWRLLDENGVWVATGSDGGHGYTVRTWAFRRST